MMAKYNKCTTTTAKSICFRIVCLFSFKCWNTWLLGYTSAIILFPLNFEQKSFQVLRYCCDQRKENEGWKQVVQSVVSSVAESRASSGKFCARRGGVGGVGVAAPLANSLLRYTLRPHNDDIVCLAFFLDVGGCQSRTIRFKLGGRRKLWCQLTLASQQRLPSNFLSSTSSINHVL